jgi:hypothetical protein
VKKLIFSFNLFLILFFPVRGLAETLYPLSSLDAHTLPKGKLEVRLGAKYMEDRWFPFEGKNTNRRELYLPYVSLNVGIADNVEVHFDYPYIFLDSDRTNSDWDSGDITLGVKMNLVKETSKFPALSLDFTTKLPNADYDKRFGTDETDFFIVALLAKRIWNLNIFTNTGLGIIGDPTDTNSQDDVFVYGVGVKYYLLSKLDVVAEINGWGFSSEDNNYSVSTIGAQYQLSSHWRIDTGVHFGLTDESEDWGISLGLTYMCQLW